MRPPRSIATAGGGSGSGRCEASADIEQHARNWAGLLNYESTYKSFPAIHSINHDKVPTMSWRYAISPFLGPEGSQVFSEFVQQANLPWDSPEHEPMLGKMPMQFRSLEARPDQSPTHTNVFGIVGATEAFAGGGKYRRMSDFTDGISNCIVAICLPTHSVSWNDPNGLTPEEAIQKIRSSPRPERVLLLYADGSVRRVESMSDKELRVGMTINKGDFANGPF